MAENMKLPPFLDLVGDALVFNQDDKEFIFMIPEIFFNNSSKSSIAEVQGEYVSTIGLFDYYIIDSKGKKTPLKPFRFPTMFLCKPYLIEKAKGLSLEEFNDDVEQQEDDFISEKSLDDTEYMKSSKDYRLLHFKKGDEIVSQIHVPQIIDNVELFYKLAVITAKIPTTISYEEGWKLFLENMNLNSKSYGLNAQLFGIVWGGICRDPKDISKPFRYTNMSDMHNYKPISVKMLPNYVSPYTSLVSEQFDESLRSAIMLSDMDEDKIPNSPLEKIIMQ